MDTNKHENSDKREDSPEVMAAVVKFQFAYMSRKHLHVGEKFLFALCRNIEALKLRKKYKKKGKDYEIKLMAIAVYAFGSKPDLRAEWCGKAGDIMDVLFPDEDFPR